ncbi:MAG: hypothetical protein IJX87_03705 [Clostridia bacterium]|nr:hypothetical protein [Clostridia bacterium]
MRKAAAICLAIASCFVCASCSLIGQTDVSSSNATNNENSASGTFGYDATKAIVSSTAKLEDLSAYVPQTVGMNAPIESVADLCRFVEDNVRSYSVVKMTETGTKKIYAAPSFKQLTLKENGNCILLFYEAGETEEVECSYSVSGDVYTLQNGEEEVVLEKTDGGLTYTVMFDEAYGFGVKHYYVQKV